MKWGNQTIFLNLVQSFLQKTLNSPFIQTNEWPPLSPDCNPLDYFWNKVKEKYMKTDLTSHLKMTVNERSRSKVYGKILPSLYQIRKAIRQFAGRLKVVKKEKVNVSKWFMVKIDQNFDSFFCTISSSWYCQL